jgi:hypothetical protein
MACPDPTMGRHCNTGPRQTHRRLDPGSVVTDNDLLEELEPHSHGWAAALEDELADALPLKVDLVWAADERSGSIDLSNPMTILRSSWLLWIMAQRRRKGVEMAEQRRRRMKEIIVGKWLDYCGDGDRTRKALPRLLLFS